MDRCALFVDAGYVLADGAMAVHGTRHRESVSWDYPGLLQFFGSIARDRAGLPLLRCYWYEATVEGRRTSEHDALADLPGVKLRVGRMRPGRREGVESEIHRDLTTLARNGAISDALVVSAEEDLAQVIADVQDLGVRVTIVHITVDGNWTIARALRQECDDIIEIGEAHLRPFVELIAGAEPAHDDDQYPEPAYPGRVLSNGHNSLAGLRHHQALPAGSHQGPPAIYTAPVVAEYQRMAPPAMNGQSGHAVPQLSAGAADGPGPAGQQGPAVQVPAAQAGPGPGGQGSPGQGPVGQHSPSPGQAQMPAPPHGSPAAGGQPPMGAPGVHATQQPSMPSPAGPGLQAQPAGQGAGQPLPGQPAGQPAGQGPQMQGQPVQGQPLHSQPVPGQHNQGSFNQGHQPQPVQGQPVQGQHMSGQPMGGQGQHGGNLHGPDMPGSPTGQPGMQGMSPPLPGLPPLPGMHAPPQHAQAGNGQPRPGQPLPGQPLPGQPGNHVMPGGPAHGPQGMLPRGGEEAGMPAGQPMYAVAPVGALRGAPQDLNGSPGGSGGMNGGPARQYAPPPSGRPAPAGMPGHYPAGPGQDAGGGGAPAYVPPQQGPYSGPQPAAHSPALLHPVSVSLADAVQAAHGEGFDFGQSVAHEAPALWLEAVLARKPRMPSDLEARLLQDSALPIDSLLHDEVRHALRRGFWDALERARR